MNDATEAVHLWRRETDGTEARVATLLPGQHIVVTLEPPGERDFFVTELESSQPIWRFRMNRHTIWHRYWNGSTQLAMEQAAPGWELRRDRFLARYLNATGEVWQGYYPRGPPLYPPLDTAKLGEKREVLTTHSFSVPCRGGSGDLCAAPREPASTSMSINLEVLCSRPQLLQLQGVLSHQEADSIRDQALRKGMVGSQTNDKTHGARRNSSTAWLKREESPVVDRVFKRLGEVFGLPEESLYPRGTAEMLQVLRYRRGEHYMPHTDYGGEDPHDRFLTVLLYLTDPPPAGGRTAFPEAEECQPSLGAPRLHPRKGDALAFYSMRRDGNFDRTSLHAALPVETEGYEKWLCNLWIWDPARRVNPLDFL